MRKWSHVKTHFLVPQGMLCFPSLKLCSDGHKPQSVWKCRVVISRPSELCPHGVKTPSHRWATFIFGEFQRNRTPLSKRPEVVTLPYKPRKKMCMKLPIEVAEFCTWRISLKLVKQWSNSLFCCYNRHFKCKVKTWNLLKSRVIGTKKRENIGLRNENLGSFRANLGWFWADFGLLLGVVELTSLLLSLFGLLYNFLGENWELGAPERQIDMKLRVTGTRNQCEKVGLVSGTYPYDFPMEVPPPGAVHAGDSLFV